VNARRYRFLFAILLELTLLQFAQAQDAQESVRRGNKLYKQQQYNEAVEEYEQALIVMPEALVPKFNKANSYYRLDDLSEAIDTYRDVTAESKDMKLVTGGRYNLGNCYFQQGMKQRDSSPQKAIDDLKTGIGYWREVLDIEPENEKAAKNIEVARLLIKDIIDQINKQQDPNQPQDPNQSQQQNQQQEQQQKQNQGSDPNQSEQQQQQQGQDPNQPSEPNENQQQQQQEEDAKQDEQKTQPPDTTAQEILDKEQRQRKQRQLMQNARYQKVEKDW